MRETGERRNHRGGPYELEFPGLPQLDPIDHHPDDMTAGRGDTSAEEAIAETVGSPRVDHLASFATAPLFHVAHRSETLRRPGWQRNVWTAFRWAMVAGLAGGILGALVTAIQ